MMEKLEAGQVWRDELKRPEKSQVLRTDIGGFAYRPDEADAYMDRIERELMFQTADLRAENQRMRELLRDCADFFRESGYMPVSAEKIESFLAEHP